VATETILWGKWDCTTCDTKGVSGKLKQCPHCGDPRGQAELDNVYLEAGAPVVTDPGELALARAGEDWTCKYCSSNNRGDRQKCRNCGAFSKIELDPAAWDCEQCHVANPASASACQECGLLSSRSFVPPTPGPAWTCKHCSVNNRGIYTACRLCNRIKAVADDVEWKFQWRSFNPLNWAIPWRRWLANPRAMLVVAALGIVGFIALHWAWQRMTSDIIGTVTAQNWRQTVALYEWRPVQTGQWGPPPVRTEEIKPVAGKGGLGSISNVACLQKHHHYETYQCGTQTEHYTVRESCGTRQSCSNRNNGNGSFTRSCTNVTQYCSKSKTRTVPKYCERSITAEWCDYDTQDWRVNTLRSQTFTGTKAAEMAWPKVQASGDLEYTKRTGAWKVVFAFEHRDEQKTHEKPMSQASGFDDWPLGTEVVLTIENSGKILALRKTTDPPRKR